MGVKERCNAKLDFKTITGREDIRRWQESIKISTSGLPSDGTDFEIRGQVG